MEFDMFQALLPGFKAALTSPVLWLILAVGILVAYVKSRLG